MGVGLGRKGGGGGGGLKWKGERGRGAGGQQKAANRHTVSLGLGRLCALITRHSQARFQHSHSDLPSQAKFRVLGLSLPLFRMDNGAMTPPNSLPSLSGL